MAIELGKDSDYPKQFDSALLEAIPRVLSRGENPSIRYSGADYWTAFEVSWLNQSGLPQVAWAEFSIPADSKNIVESKSFKYYLNSYNQAVFNDREQVASQMRLDLSAVADATVEVQLHSLSDEAPLSIDIPGDCLDGLDVEINEYEPNPDLLKLEPQSVENCQVYTHLFKSNCPVTGQPDWATLWLAYSGQAIDSSTLLKYLLSFRNHQGFHEACVEQIYSEINERCQPSELCVYARYTRRGGLDINPYRVSKGWQNKALPFGRLLRQ
jgi:7-cyano-7-deazaguanine reductase